MSSIRRRALSETPFGKRGSSALRFHGLLKGKSMKDSGAGPGILHIAGLFVSQLIDGLLREVANTAVFTTVEKHLVPEEQVFGR